MDLPILKYIFILSLDLQQTFIYIYIVFKQILNGIVVITILSIRISQSTN